MESKVISRGIIRAVITLLLIALLLYFFYAIRLVFAYLAISAIIALMGRPVVNVMEKRLRVPVSIGATVTLFLFFAILVSFLTLFVSLVLNQPFGLDSIHSVSDLEETLQEQVATLNSSVIDLDLGFLSDYVSDFIKGLNFQEFSGFFSDSISFLGARTMDAFAVFFVSFFFLKDKNLLNDFILSLVPDNIEHQVEAVLEKIKGLLSRYFIGLFLQALIMFVIYIAILLSFGIDNAAVIAVICAFMNLIPYIGPVLGGFIMGVLSLSDLFTKNQNILDNSSFTTLGFIMVCYLFAQLWDNFVNQPQIYSKSVKANPLEIFIVILMGGILFGLVGVLIAVPLYTVLRVFLNEFFSEFKLVQKITSGLN